MKRFYVIMIALAVLMSLSCSENKGSFMDFAAIKDAQRTMTKFTNLMEQYYVEHETYPLDQTVFETDMRPYFITYNTENKPVDKWDEMVVKVFADKKVLYTTKDPKKSYFIYGKAKDSNNTIVFCRPAQPHTDSLNINNSEQKKK